MLAKEALFAEGEKWEAASAIAAERSAGSSMSQAQALIAWLALSAGGAHSGYLTREEVEVLSEEVEAIPPSVSTTDGISTVVVPSLAQFADTTVAAYRSAGIAAFDAAVSTTSCGWIVDLRQNGGGNTYPMLSTIAPLLPAGPVAGFRDRHGDEQWIASSGTGYIDVAGEPRVARPVSDMPVAVLLSPQTASAAELVALSLRSNSRVRFFGQQTAGLTTANQTFTLSDESMLTVSIAHYVDAEGNVIDGPIRPDVVVNTVDAVGAEAEAESWLRTACAS